MKDLFTPEVKKSKLNQSFLSVSKFQKYIPARELMNSVFQSLIDNDGNFLEQFQTKGFDQRVFELFLHAYFSHENYTLDQSHIAPDFLIEKNGVSVAIEVTTSNSSTELNIDLVVRQR